MARPFTIYPVKYISDVIFLISDKTYKISNIAYEKYLHLMRYFKYYIRYLM